MGDALQEWWADFGTFGVALLRIVLILAVAFLLNRMARRVIRGFLNRLKESPDQPDRQTTRQETLGMVLRSAVTIVVFTVAVFMVLSEVNIDLAPLIASAGIAGVAIGFGAQTLVRDFLSGFFLLVEDQFGVGDVIDVGEASGTVEALNLRTTEIRDVNGTLWHVPNGEIKRVANKSQDWARAVLDVEVAYNTDMNLAMHVIKEVADAVWHDALENATITEEPQIWGVENFGENAISIRLAMKVQPGEQWSTAREIRRRLKLAFDEHGIEIPFPQRVMWIKRGEDDEGPIDRLDEDSFLPRGAPDEV